MPTRRFWNWPKRNFGSSLPGTIGRFANAAATVLPEGDKVIDELEMIKPMRL